MSVVDYIDKLRKTLSEKLPYCSGTLLLEPRHFLLYYGKENLGRVDLAHASSDALDHLEKTCLPATFGRSGQDVLDETYRKAGKLDTDSFVIAFEPIQTGLLEAVKNGLFSGSEGARDIKAELYKLNVYGRDAFFKSHKDTPRARNMFGSLVVVFPTLHEGGTLVLHHGDNEWTFDSGKILSEPNDSNSIAFVAFFSDVDHEVTPVISGHRVTVTYNLYFAPADPSRLNVANAHIDRPTSVSTSAISSVLAELLANRDLLPHGGTLGFGLQHQYPLPSTWSDGDPSPLDDLKRWLKGSDAALLHACTSLDLLPFLRLAYEDDRDGNDEGNDVLSYCPVDFQGQETEDDRYDCMCDRYGAVRVNIEAVILRKDGSDGYGPVSDGDGTGNAVLRVVDNRRYYGPTVHMVTPLSAWNKLKSVTLMYGNESYIDLMYGNVCLIVDVGPFGRRQEVDVQKWGWTGSDSETDDDMIVAH